MVVFQGLGVHQRPISKMGVGHVVPFDVPPQRKYNPTLH